MSLLVMLTPGFPTDEADTSCLPAFQQFALSVKKLRPVNDFLIISFQYPFEKKEYTWNGIRVIAIGGANKPGFRRLLTWVKAYFILKKLHRTEGLTGIFSLWLSECTLVGKYFSKRNKIKHLSWLIGQDAKTSNQYISRIKPRGNEIIAMSDFLKAEYSKNHGEIPFMVAENGINESAFPSFNTGHRDIDILGVGSLIKLKNYDLFIEIVECLKREKPGIKAMIVGTGVDEAYLKNLVKQKNLSDTILFAGLVPHSEVFNLMNRSRIFLHTSTYEGNSTVLMEALYSGCYTFSTCPLAERETPRLKVLNTKEEFVKEITQVLNQSTVAERITFNTMDHSAKKILDLFQ